jgi:predicted aspartyl protease
MVEGEFIDGNKPVVQAGVAWDQSIQNPYFILDTGFTGDLAITPQIARDLGLQIGGSMHAQNATGKIENIPFATAYAVMEGMTLFVTVLITDGIPLLGISFMEKFNYKAVIDCKNKKVGLEMI